MSYLGSAPSNQTPTYKQVYEYTATAGQTSFAASYTVGFVEVYRNGVKLGSSDFTATTGTTVVLASGASAGDFVQVVSLFINATMSSIPNTAGAVATANIADGNVTTAKIADANITQAKLATNVAGTGPAFSAYQSSSQSITLNSTTKVQFQSKNFDTANCFDNTTNYRFTPNVPGYYQINCSLQWGAQTWAELNIYKNGTGFCTLSYSYNASVSSVGGSRLMYLNGSTDYIEIYLRWGNNPAGLAANNNTYFEAFLVRAA